MEDDPPAASSSVDKIGFISYSLESMKKSLTLILLALAPAIGAAPISNPSFDDGLTGWQSTGVVSANSGTARLSAYYTVLDHNTTTPIADLLTFAPVISQVVPQSVLEGTHPWVQIYNGSAISQSFSVAEDSTVSVDLSRWLAYADSFLVFSVSLEGQNGLQSFLGSSWETGFSTPVNPGHLSFDFDAPVGDYSLVIAAMATQPASPDVGLDVFGVRVQPQQPQGVPDGGMSAGMLAIGLLGLRLIRK